MAERDVSLETIKKLEHQLNDLEDEHTQEKRVFQRKQEELYDRRLELERMIDQEDAQRFYLLKKYEGSYDTLSQYFTELADVREDLFTTYRDCSQQLEWQEDQHDKTFRKRYRDIEEKLGKLRRDYANTTS